MNRRPGAESPTVSVVIPAHDAAGTIGASLTSALWQTYPHVEVVVVDDGSGDRTADIVEAYQDHRLRLVRQPQAGVSSARNRGLQESRGELVALLDSDDVLMPGYLDACVDVWQRSGGIVTSNAYWMFVGGIDPALRRHRRALPSPPQQRLALLEQNWVSLMSVFPRRLADEIGPFDEGLSHAEDWDFWLRAVYAGWTVHQQPRPLALYNRSRPSATTHQRKMYDAERVVLARMAARDDLRGEERNYLQRRLAGPAPGELATQADDLLARARYREASDTLAQAAVLCPNDAALVWKARLMRLAPALVGRQLRRRAERRWSVLGPKIGDLSKNP